MYLVPAYLLLFSTVLEKDRMLSVVGSVRLRGSWDNTEPRYVRLIQAFCVAEA